MEFSDDVFIISKETAERYKRPPQLSSLVLAPEQVQTQPGQQYTFIARGFDQDGRAMATGELTWTATGGSVDQYGVFLAGQEEGQFVVTATAGAVSGSATVIITRAPTHPSPSTPKLRSGKMWWTGEVPPQKWMNFYTKVLSRFAASKGLKITLTVEVSQDGGASEQKIEETKVALRELGLNDNVSVEGTEEEKA
ncbi:MAG: hypothetical protein HC774_02780 [Sphingomonadales bacterium]|nr:hypothetical protein [Sphingomonadales bacterium]